MQYINTPTIILGKANPLDPDNTNNQAILILKYYLYKFKYLSDKPSINGGPQYFLSSAHKEYIRKMWLPFETVLGV